MEKERQKAEKLAKFEAKKKAAAQQQPAGPSKKEKKKTEPGGAPGSSAAYKERTPKGDKKILESLDDDFHKAYIPGVVESAWYDWWEKEGFMKPEFKPDGHIRDEGKFVIVIPPPNVTGKLHCGHALAIALQDTLIRWNRMKGKTVLYLPGCDHAGISTQSVVENMLWRKEKKTRHDFARPEFLKKVWEWKDEYHQEINRVIRRLGGSVDWSREAFTMDENLSKAVTETFVKLHEEGLIYRSNRLVNWCTQLNTALSNLEVDNKDLEGRTMLDVPGYDRKIEFGVIVHFKYQIEGSDETIEVATTRIETMLGDSGIAVHPKDDRYKHLVGKKARHPIIADRLMPIVADDYVDPEFGTGAVKLTPAHDPNDFNLGKKHDLEFINILNDNGTLNQNAGPFAGQKRFEARYTVIAELEKLNLFVKKENNPMKVPLCAKSKDVIEPLMKPQWWMSMKSLAEPAIEAVKDGRINIKPDSAVRNYMHWMTNINDWCLSRQLWWGHQVPAYFIKLEGGDSDQSNNDLWITGRTEEEAQTKASQKFPNQKFTLERDPDVLDTWFSSGLWPFSTMGWPNDTQDFRELYPTSTLETGWDILFFWVARMIMFGLKLTNNIPFNEVYCHSLIRDSEGRKMSKSLGNVIDPVDILEGIELQALHDKLHVGNLDPKEVKNAEKYQKTAFPQGIPECGADALRFSLVQYTTGGGDIAFDVRVMAGYRRFCNKIYQATKYVLGKLPSDYSPPSTATAAASGVESLAEKWILHKLTIAARDVNKALSEREFSRATQLVYAYWYYHLCDVYIENSKSIIAEGDEKSRLSAINTLYTALEGGLTMMHPFMPFLTEELWQRLPRRTHDPTRTILKAPYPEYNAAWHDADAEAQYDLVLGMSRALRSLLAEYSIKDSGAAYILPLTPHAHRIAQQQEPSLRRLADLSGKTLASLTLLAPDAPKPRGCAVFPVGRDAAAFVHVKGRVDLDAEIAKAKAKLAKAAEGVDKQQKLLDGVRAGGTASAAIVDGEAAKLADACAEVTALDEALKQFEVLKLEE